MTTLNDLVTQSKSIINNFSSGDIPLYVNGTPMNVKLEIKQDCNNKYWIDMTFNKDV